MILRTTTFAAAFCMAASVASAASVSLFSGSANELTNVTDAADSALASDTIQYFLEAENKTFTTNQNVNMDDEVPILAGTEMNSYVIFLNTVSDSLVEAFAGFVFDGDVLGVIYYDSLLNRSGTRYGASHGTLDGIEIARGDSVSFTGNRLAVSLNNRDGLGDWIRVLTSTSLSLQDDSAQQFDDGAIVPLPATGLLMLAGLAGFAGLRRRKGTAG